MTSCCREFLSVSKQLTLIARNLLRDFERNVDSFALIESSIHELNSETREIEKRMESIKVNQNFSNSVIIINTSPGTSLPSPSTNSPPCSINSANQQPRVDGFNFNPNNLKFISEYSKLIQDRLAIGSANEQSSNENQGSIESSLEQIDGKATVDKMIKETISQASSLIVQDLHNYDSNSKFSCNNITANASNHGQDNSCEMDVDSTNMTTNLITDLDDISIASIPDCFADDSSNDSDEGDSNKPPENNQTNETVLSSSNETTEKLSTLVDFSDKGKTTNGTEKVQSTTLNDLSATEAIVSKSKSDDLRKENHPSSSTSMAKTSSLDSERYNKLSTDEDSDCKDDSAFRSGAREKVAPEDDEPEIISLETDDSSSIPQCKLNLEEGATALDSDGELFDLNIGFEKNKRTEKRSSSKESRSEANNLRTWDYGDDCQSVSECSDDDDDSIFSAKSARSSRNKAGLSANRKKSIPLKTKDYQINLVRLPDRLIELASRDAIKAIVEIEKYEKKVIMKAMKAPLFSRFNFKIFTNSTSVLPDAQPSTSGLKRKPIFLAKNVFDDFLNLSDEDSQPASKKPKNSQVLQNDNEAEENIKSKGAKKRKRVFSSSDEYDDESSICSFTESFNFTLDDQAKSTSKSKKDRYHYHDIYSSDSSSDEAMIDETILDDRDMDEIIKIFEKPTRKLRKEKLSVEQSLKQPQVNEEKENEKDHSKKIQSISGSKVITNNRQTIQTDRQSKARKPVGKRTAPAKENETDKKKRTIMRKPIERRDSIQQFSTKDLSEETEREGRLEIQRIKRIQQITDRFKDINRLTELTNEESVVLEYGNDGQPLVQIDPILAKLFKDHQKEGVRFLYLNAIESIDKLEKSGGKSGLGSILAHNAGLGKTFQIIAFIHCLLNNVHTQKYFRSILIVTPLNVLRNWYHEIKKWILSNNLSMPFFRFDECKTYHDKIEMLKSWQEIGGAMFLSHGSFWKLIINKEIDEPEEYFELSKQLLLDPGPDLVVVDEGHVIKNKKVKLNESLSRVKTKRRILLSGTPLQNNLEEYYNMCHYVRANLLGTYVEFKSNFQVPIEAGQDDDSSPADVKLMQQRTCILQKVLKRVLHRVDYSILKKDLLPMHEFVLKIRLSDIQDKLYREFKRRVENNVEEVCEVGNEKKPRLATFLQHWSVFNKIYNHPLMLKSGMTAKLNWCKDILNEETDPVKMSSKIQVFLSILKQCEKNGEKLVVFSQYPPLLDAIKQVLDDEQTHRCSVPHLYRNQYKTFQEGIDYFRCDGTSSVEVRQGYFDKFNDSTNKQTRLFLLTTRACGIGINLIGANRCIIFDASWNPWNDIQSIFRTYRYGQTKEVYIYRFISYATWEEKIYQKQVQKEWLSNRVIDDHQSKRYFNSKNKRIYYEYEPKFVENHTHTVPEDDDLLAEVLKSNSKLIVDYHRHNSLLERDPDQYLTEEEKQEAWIQYEEQKKMKDQQRSADKEHAKNDFLSTLGLHQSAAEEANLQYTTCPTSNQQASSDIRQNKSSTQQSKTSSILPNIGQTSTESGSNQPVNSKPESFQTATKSPLGQTVNSLKTQQKVANPFKDTKSSEFSSTIRKTDRPTLGQLRDLLSKAPISQINLQTSSNAQPQISKQQRSAGQQTKQQEDGRQRVFFNVKPPIVTTQQNFTNPGIGPLPNVTNIGQSFTHLPNLINLLHHTAANASQANYRGANTNAAHLNQTSSQPLNYPSNKNHLNVGPNLIGQPQMNQPEINRPQVNSTQMNQPQANLSQMNQPYIIIQNPNTNRSDIQRVQQATYSKFRNQQFPTQPQFNVNQQRQSTFATNHTTQVNEPSYGPNQYVFKPVNTPNPFSTQQQSRPMNQPTQPDLTEKIRNLVKPSNPLINIQADENQRIQKNAHDEVINSIISMAKLLEPLVPLDFRKILDELSHTTTRKLKQQKNTPESARRNFNLRVLEQEMILIQDFIAEPQSLVSSIPEFSQIFNPELRRTTLRDQLEILD